MKDRYLFRGKRLDNGEWIIGSYVPAYRQGWAEKAQTIIIPISEKTYLIEIDPSTIGQCTGLNDKNGKLIFEGDIVKANKNLTLNVRYNKGQYELGDREKNGYFVLSIYKQEELEIIGNVHDRAEETTC